VTGSGNCTQFLDIEILLVINDFLQQKRAETVHITLEHYQMHGRNGMASIDQAQLVYDNDESSTA
jgi:hypothetical protein